MKWWLLIVNRDSRFNNNALSKTCRHILISCSKTSGVAEGQFTLSTKLCAVFVFGFCEPKREKPSLKVACLIKPKNRQPFLPGTEVKHEDRCHIHSHGSCCLLYLTSALKSMYTTNRRSRQLNGDTKIIFSTGGETTEAVGLWLRCGAAHTNKMML